MTETKIGPCQCCGTVTRLFSGASRFGDPTWACDECWRPDERPSEVVNTAYGKFNGLVQAWADLDRECSRTYIAWQAACRMRERAAIEKNNAWAELEKARIEEHVTLVSNGNRA